MPYRWTRTDSPADADPVLRLTLWPHQSLTANGFAMFIGATAAMAAMPLMAVLGSAVAWVLLAFFLLAFWGLWTAVMKNREHQSLHEDLALWRDRVRLHHVRPSRDPLEWEANPYWVSVHLRAEGGPVENYLTLRGSGREVELGAFLSPEERLELYHELKSVLVRL